MSPRRSSRAKAVAHHSASNHHHSSSSSASSARGTSTRPQRGKDASPINDTFRAYSRESRASSSARNNGAILHEDIVSGDEEDEEPEDEDEEEVTRCICGFAEYQGEDGQEASSDGFFIQCDKCHVWQHGFCVGIMGSDFAPENYWCEKCKPDLHKLVIRAHGPKSSIYLPVHGEDSPSDLHHSTKRRSTMNSRDAAYDEDMILARVLEESKTEVKVPGTTTATTTITTTTTGRQRRKRPGSETPEDSKENKRRRTSESSESGQQGGSSGSGDEASNSGANSRKGRNNSTKNSEKTSTKRSSGRSTVKHEKVKDVKKDDSDHSDDSVDPVLPLEKPARIEHIPIPVPTITETPPIVPAPSATNIAPIIPTTITTTTATTVTPSKDEQVPAPPTPAKEKQSDTPQKRRTNATGIRRNRKVQSRFSEDPNSDNPTSHAMARDHSIHDAHHGHKQSSDKPSKPRIPQPKMTMKEMVKRVKQISSYISQTQIEMATKSTPLPAPLTGRTDSTSSSVDTEKDDIRSTEMMDALTRKIVRWQKTYG